MSFSPLLFCLIPSLSSFSHLLVRPIPGPPLSSARVPALARPLALCRRRLCSGRGGSRLRSLRRGRARRPSSRRLLRGRGLLRRRLVPALRASRLGAPPSRPLTTSSRAAGLEYRQPEPAGLRPRRQQLESAGLHPKSSSLTRGQGMCCLRQSLLPRPARRVGPSRLQLRSRRGRSRRVPPTRTPGRWSRPRARRRSRW